MAEAKLEKLDVRNLKLEDLDTLDHDALKEALTSVLRDPTASMQHQDHRSHSSSTADFGEMKVEGLDEMHSAHGGHAVIRTRVAPIKKGAAPVEKTAPPVDKTSSSADR